MRTIYALIVGVFFLIGLIISHGEVPPVSPPGDTFVITTFDYSTGLLMVAPTDAADARLAQGDPLVANTSATDTDVSALKAKQDGLGGCACASK